MFEAAIDLLILFLLGSLGWALVNLNFLNHKKGGLKAALPGKLLIIYLN